MKPFLSFIGGCEFLAILQEIQAHPERYFQFDGFYAFEDSDATDAYLYLKEYGQAIIRQKPDAIIISQSDALWKCIPRIQFNKVESKAEQAEQLADIVRQCEEMINILSEANAPILLQFLPWYRTKMLNRFKPNPAVYNEAQFLRKYITAMEELAVKYPSFYFMDFSDACSIHGYHHTLSREDRPWYTHPTKPAVYLATEFAQWINYVLRLNTKVKCVLVDLDNTMWNGVLRDVGVEQLDINASFRFRWEVLRILYSRGILIGVISKNDPYLEEQIRQFIGQNLWGTKFVCFELSWDDKWQVVKRVQEKLNIGLDSILFIDDSKFEQTQMKTMLPEMLVCNETIFENLLYLAELQPEFVTDESKKRTDLYIQEDRRKSTSQSLTKEQFLKQCDFKIKIEKMKPFEVSRVTELITRTNQLNTSIKRYTQQEVIQLDKDDNCEVSTVYVSDKFGDYGLVGVCIGVKGGDTYEIDTLLFSCRVMSKGVEDYLLTSILTDVKQAGFTSVIIKFRKGAKNAGMRSIIENNHFVRSGTDGELDVYAFDLQGQQIKPLPTWFSQMDSTDQNSPADAVLLTGS